MSDSRPLVVKIGGAGVDDPGAMIELWRTLAELHRMVQGRLVLVHGGGRAVDHHLERLGLATERREGIRITPPQHMEQIAGILAGRVNKLLVGALLAHGISAVGLCLGDGAAIRTAHSLRLGFDPGRVGEVTGGDGALLRLLMSERFMPVLCSIGLDQRGQLLNVNADDAAAGVARVLHARALVLLTDVPGILDERGERLASLSASEVEGLIARGTIAGGMIPKARAAATAAQIASAPAIIASFKTPHDLLALADGEALGTRITTSGPDARSIGRDTRAT